VGCVREGSKVNLLGVSTLDWGQWFYGLTAGFIGGGSSAVVSGVTINMMDPQHFNARNADFYILVGAMFVANGLMSMFMFLKQNPLPPEKKIVTTVTVERKESGGPSTDVGTDHKPKEP
jgi:hypothetical protein